MNIDFKRPLKTKNGNAVRSAYITVPDDVDSDEIDQLIAYLSTLKAIQNKEPSLEE